MVIFTFMSEFGSPSQVLRLLVSGRNADSPSFQNFDAADSEVAKRRASDWERQIESIDQKEMEVHKSQLKLIREQTANFTRDLLSVRQEVATLKMAQEATMAELTNTLDTKHRELRAAADKEVRERDSVHERVHGRINILERDLPKHKDDLNDLRQIIDDFTGASGVQAMMDRERRERESTTNRIDRRLSEVSTSLNQHDELKQDLQAHKQVSQEAERKMQAHKQETQEQLAKLRDSLGKADFHHGPLNERLDNLVKDIEVMVAKQVAELQAKLGGNDETRVRVENIEKGLTEFVAALKTHGGNCATLVERVSYMEQAMGDSADRHRTDCESAHKRLDELHNKLSQHQRQILQHISIQDRVDYLEKTVGDSAEKHSVDLAMAHSKLKDLQKDKATKDKHHANIDERINYLENMLGDSANKHLAELSSLRAAHDKHMINFTKHCKEVECLKSGHAQHATMAERIDHLEKVVVETAGRHEEDVTSLRSASDKLHAKVSSHESQHASTSKAHGAISSELKAISAHAAQAHDKIGAVEEVHTEVATKLEDLKAKHEKYAAHLSRHTKDLEIVKAAQLKHVVLETQLDNVQRSSKDRSDKHESELANATAQLDRIHQKVSNCDKLGSTVEDLRRSHTAMANDHRETIAHHAGVKERLDYLERLVGDSADKHAAVLADLKAAQDKHAVSMSKQSQELDRGHHSSMEDTIQAAHEKIETLCNRVQTVEKSHAGVADMHKALKDAQSKHGRELENVKNVHSRHATLEERLEYMEKSVGDSADQHAAELAAAHAKLDQLHNRVKSSDALHNTLNDLKKAHGALSTEKAQLESSHASLNDRVAELERAVSESTEKHAKLLDAAHSKVDQLHGRMSISEKSAAAVSDLKKSQNDLAHGKASLESHHASLKDRMDYIEKLVGDSAEKHAKDVETLKLAHERHNHSLSKHAKDMESLKSVHGHHATIAERLDDMERSMKDVAGKHADEISAIHRKTESIGTQITQERSARDKHNEHVKEIATKTKNDQDLHQATVKQRVEYLESLIGDNADRHAKEVAEAKVIATKIANEAKSDFLLHHGSIADRLADLENVTTETAKHNAEELQAAHSRLDQMSCRFNIVKDAWVSDQPTSPAHSAFSGKLLSPMARASTSASCTSMLAARSFAPC